MLFPYDLWGVRELFSDSTAKFQDTQMNQGELCSQAALNNVHCLP